VWELELKVILMKKELINYTKYNVWANERIVGVIGNLSDEQIERTVVSSFPSIRGTLLHIWDAESLWLDRLKGGAPTEFPSKYFKGDNRAVFTSLIESSKYFGDFVAKQKVTFLNSSLKTKSLAGIESNLSVHNMIHHCMNHSTMHRGQLITFIRQVEDKDNRMVIPSIDFSTYCRENQ
jgi:uncharacterized damage-inducible protein DinB